MQIELQGLNKVLADLKKYNPEKLENAMNKSVILVQGSAKELCPTNTGNLRGSIHTETRKNGKEIVGKVYTNVNYAPYVEFGTGIKGNGTYPYKIKGVSLAYRGTKWTYTPDGGEHFYKTSGQVAKPFMYPALLQNKDNIQRIFKESIGK